MITRNEGMPGGRRPTLAFLGTGWIGRARLSAVVESGRADVVGVADPSPAARAAALEIAPGAEPVAELGGLLELQPDGVVIASPSALHAGQAGRVLRHGAAVFCQKPLGRSEAETRLLIDTAKRTDRLLHVDLSYRYVDGIEALRSLVQQGEIGRVFAVDLTFHNAYGPDRPWFYSRRQAGGGCLLDLGTHLVDLALWVLDHPEPRTVRAHLFREGRPLDASADHVEDFAAAEVEMEDGTLLRLACSWKLAAGRDAVIRADFHGTEGGVSWRNVDGSFHDFGVERFSGTSRSSLVEGGGVAPRTWGGGAILEWVDRLRRGGYYDRRVEEILPVARLLDQMYRQGTTSAPQSRASRPAGSLLYRGGV